jgi:hypothetical protein
VIEEIKVSERCTAMELVYGEFINSPHSIKPKPCEDTLLWADYSVILWNDFSCLCRNLVKLLTMKGVKAHSEFHVRIASLT